MFDSLLKISTPILKLKADERNITKNPTFHLHSHPSISPPWTNPPTSKSGSSSRTPIPTLTPPPCASKRSSAPITSPSIPITIAPSSPRSNRSKIPRILVPIVIKEALFLLGTQNWKWVLKESGQGFRFLRKWGKGASKNLGLEVEKKLIFFHMDRNWERVLKELSLGFRFLGTKLVWKESFFS
ncbi:uncharacterized protein M6B38_187415 [Iris pallida]|uniref:Uncharacterized protein n=1 Tax=Iris pallida TaxID=29817 RepID=A0AAX6EIF8_IRIPA|nr:uncharacterized protein M6B38_187415 [Iris pallida]